MSTRRRAREPVPAEAVEHLRAADPILRDIIDRVGPFERSVEPDLWWSLVDAIASQQLSVKAAAAIVGRLRAISAGEGAPTPADVLAASEDELRACGLSRPKVRYLRDLAEKWTDGTLTPQQLPQLPDDALVEQLTRVKGIGRWTAEMALLFSLRRPDVLPVDDLGLRNAVQRAYGLSERPSREEFTALGEPWRPFRSAASLYLWRSLDVLPAIG